MSKWITKYWGFGIFILLNFVVMYNSCNQKKYNTHPKDLLHLTKDIRLNDTVSYKVGNHLIDSIKSQQEFEEKMNLGDYFNSTKVGLIGFSDMDTSNKWGTYNWEYFDPIHPYYVDIYGYSLDAHFQFHYNGKNGWLFRLFSNDTPKLVTVKYKWNENKQAVQIPITLKQYNTYNISINLLYYCLVGSILLWCFAKVYIILVLIGRKLAFDAVTVKHTNQLYKLICIFPFTTLLYHAIIRLYFNKYFSTHLQFNWESFWDDNKYYYLVSMLVYSIYTVFKRGMELEQEADLTI